MRIHLDHNATTTLRPEARERWLEVSDALGGNPSSLHAGGRRARDIVDGERARVAAALGVLEDEITFTSGGTEGNNLALAGVLEALPPGERGRRGLVTTAVEHASVLETARALEAKGHPLDILGVSATGMPDMEALRSRLATESPALVSVMGANNEVGVVPDLFAVGDLLKTGRGPRPRFHTDAVQLLGRLPVDLAGWGADLATFSAHKVGGPLGTGVLWCRTGVHLAPLMHGGEQEAGRRPGTEDVAGIAAAACAIELAVRDRDGTHARLAALTCELWSALSARLPQLELLGPPLDARTLGLDPEARTRPCRLPNTLCVRVPQTDGKVLVTRLDLAGLEASAGSACASGSIEPSHVLLAMGLDANAARAGLRLSLGRTTTRDECMQAVDLLTQLLTPSRAT